MHFISFSSFHLFRPSSFSRGEPSEPAKTGNCSLSGERLSVRLVATTTTTTTTTKAGETKQRVRATYFETAPEALNARGSHHHALHFLFSRLASLARYAPFFLNLEILFLQSLEALFQFVELLLLFRVRGVDFFVLVLKGIQKASIEHRNGNNDQQNLTFQKFERFYYIS